MIGRTLYVVLFACLTVVLGGCNPSVDTSVRVDAQRDVLGDLNGSFGDMGVSVVDEVSADAEETEEAGSLPGMDVLWEDRWDSALNEVGPVDASSENDSSFFAERVDATDNEAGVDGSALMDRPANDVGSDRVLTDAGVLADAVVSSDVPPPGTLFSASIHRLVSSCGMTCVVTTGGEVYCWGGTERSGIPFGRSNRAHRIEELRNIVEMSIGCDVACAVDRSGRVWCWGDNYRGSLGTGSTENPLRTPRMVTAITDATHVAVPGIFVRRGDGSVYTWGQWFAPTQPPQRVALPGAVLDIRTIGHSGYCMRLADGRFLCGGVRPPDGMPVVEEPQILTGTEGTLSIRAGVNYWCAVKQDRTVWCWGANAKAQLGHSPDMDEICFLDVPPPMPLTIRWRCQPRATRVEGLTGVEEVSLGVEESCARRTDGTVWCWGGSFFFDHSLRPPRFETFGDGRAEAEVCIQPSSVPASITPPPAPCRRQPYLIPSLRGVTALVVGGDPSYVWRGGYGCAALSSGQVWCWGANNDGQLGDGTNIHRATPVPVRY